MQTSEQGPIKTGSKLGAYEVGELICLGHANAIYCATHCATGKQVALRMLLPERATDPIEVQRSMHAARAQARISNDHVLAIYDFGISATGLPYTIMERIVGRNMKALLAEEKTIAPARARHLFAQVCKAMEAVHKKNIAHRDLKPANFLITGAQEKITVIDFSTCREMEMEPGNMPAPIAIVGTPYYMSPEQCLGRPSDQRSDIYAVGCCIFEAIFGTKPFIGKTSDETMRLHTSEKPQIPQGRPTELTGLTEVVLKCLEKDPQDRFQTMYQLGRALTD